MTEILTPEVEPPLPIMAAGCSIQDPLPGTYLFRTCWASQNEHTTEQCVRAPGRHAGLCDEHYEEYREDPSGASVP